MRVGGRGEGLGSGLQVMEAENESSLGDSEL